MTSALFLVLISLSGCFSLSPDISFNLSPKFDGDGVAVLPFAVYGAISPHIRISAADRLSDALYIFDNYKIIDRSVVNEALQKHKMNSLMMLSERQINELGSDLKCKYLIVGKIESFSNQDIIDDNSPSNIYLTLRIISTKSAQILGIFQCNRTISEKDNPQMEILSIIDNVAKKLRK